MPDTDFEYKGVHIIVNSKALPDGSWSAVFTLHDDTVTPFTIDPILGSTQQEVEQNALAEARKQIDKKLFHLQIIKGQEELQS